MFAVQPCGYANGFLLMQKKNSFLKPKIIITQACSCLMQRSLKAIKMIIFGGDSH